MTNRLRLRWNTAVCWIDKHQEPFCRSRWRKRTVGNSVYFAPGYWRGLWYLFVLLAVSTALGMISTIQTYRRTSSLMVKHQLRWVVVGLACAVATIIADLVLTLLHAQSDPVTALLLLGVVPLAFAFGLLRYRLFGVDLTRQSVLYGLLTALLAAVYFALVGLSAHYLGVTSDSRWYVVIVLLSAFLIAMLVNPLQTGLQSVIDRRFFSGAARCAAGLDPLER